jgi:chromate transporter
MTLLQLAWHLFILCFVAFGAATAILPDLHRVFVDTGVMSDSTFGGLFAMSQAAPGTNVMFVTVLGWQVSGLAGAFTATVSFLAPTGIIAVAIERFGSRYHKATWHVIIRRSLAPVTIGLLASTGYILARNTLTPIGLALCLATFAMLTWSKRTPLWMTGLGAVLGALGLV